MTLLLILFYLLLYYNIRQSKIRNKEKYFIVVVTIVMIFISGFRHPAVGNDTYATMLKFDEYAAIEWKSLLTDFWYRLTSTEYSDRDPAEIFLYKCMSYICIDSRMFLIVFSAMILTCLGVINYKLKNNLLTLLFVYIFFASFFYQYIPNSSTRQPVAVILIYFSYLSFNKKKFLRAVTLIVIASLFHKSAFIGLVLLGFMFSKKVKTIYLLSVIFFLIVMFYYQEVAILLVGINEVYSDYASGAYYQNTSRPVNVILFYIAMYLIALFKLFRDKTSEDNRMQYYGTALTLIFVPLIWVDPSLLRIGAYFGLFVPMLIARLYSENREVLIILAIVLLLNSFKDDGYRFMWQEKKMHDRYAYINTSNVKRPKTVQLVS